MNDGTGLAEAMLGLDGFLVLEITETVDELVISVETTTRVTGCRRCGTRAGPHERRPVDVWDLACFGRPVRLRVLKRRWRCIEPACEAKTWTEQHPGLPARHVMTARAGFGAASQVGELARPHRPCPARPSNPNQLRWRRFDRSATPAGGVRPWPCTTGSQGAPRGRPGSIRR